MMKMLASLWVKNLRYVWSNKKLATIPKEVTLQHSIKSIDELSVFVKDCYKKFEWVADGKELLFDAMNSPEYCWYKMTEEPPLQDDCDGFHSAIMWGLRGSFESRIITIVYKNILLSHSFLILKHLDKFYLVDYDFVIPVNGEQSLKNAVSEFEKFYHREDSEILCTEISKWENRRWKTDKDFIK
jgi:hypothetical protein